MIQIGRYKVFLEIVVSSYGDRSGSMLTGSKGHHG